MDDIDDQYDENDQDFRGDQDFRLDQDIRDDEDFRGDMDFRAGERGPHGQGIGSQFQEHFGSQQQGNFNKGPKMGSHGGGPHMGSHGRGGGGPRRGFHGDRNFGNESGFEEMDLDEYEQSYNAGPMNRHSDSGLLGEGPPVSQQRQFGQKGLPSLMDLSFEKESADLKRRDHSPSPGHKGRGHASHGDRGRGKQDGFRNRGRGGNRGGMSNWNEEGSQGESSFSEGNDSFNDSQGSFDNGFKGGNQRGGRGKARGSDSYRGGERRGGRGGQRGNFRGGDNRSGGGFRGGRGRGGRGGRGGH